MFAGALLQDWGPQGAVIAVSSKTRKRKTSQPVRVCWSRGAARFKWHSTYEDAGRCSSQLVLARHV